MVPSYEMNPKQCNPKYIADYIDHSKSAKGGKVRGGQDWEESKRAIIEKEKKGN